MRVLVRFWNKSFCDIGATTLRGNCSTRASLLPFRRLSFTGISFGLSRDFLETRRCTGIVVDSTLSLTLSFDFRRVTFRRNSVDGMKAESPPTVSWAKSSSISRWRAAAEASADVFSPSCICLCASLRSFIVAARHRKNKARQDTTWQDKIRHNSSTFDKGMTGSKAKI